MTSVTTATSPGETLAERLAEVTPAGGHRTLADRAFAILHLAIVEGTLTPGERLPIEELAAALDMSPMPVREALRELDSVGLVDNVPHRSAHVTELSLADLADVYDARLALEPLAVHQAAERFDDDDDARATDALARHVDAYRRGDLLAAQQAHSDFHLALYRAARSRWLLRLIRTAWESSERYRAAAIVTRAKDLDRRRPEHERMLRACREHDARAGERETFNHLVRTANLIARKMGSPDLFKPRMPA